MVNIKKSVRLHFLVSSTVCPKTVILLAAETTPCSLWISYLAWVLSISEKLNLRVIIYVLILKCVIAKSKCNTLKYVHPL